MMKSATRRNQQLIEVLSASTGRWQALKIWLIISQKPKQPPVKTEIPRTKRPREHLRPIVNYFSRVGDSTHRVPVALLWKTPDSSRGAPARQGTQKDGNRMTRPSQAQNLWHITTIMGRLFVLRLVRTSQAMSVHV